MNNDTMSLLLIGLSCYFGVEEHSDRKRKKLRFSSSVSKRIRHLRSPVQYVMRLPPPNIDAMPSLMYKIEHRNLKIVNYNNYYLVD